MAPARPLPSVIGPTENALRALLNQTLSATLIPGYAAWVVLNSASNADSLEDARREAADGLQADLDEIDAVFSLLRIAGLVDTAGTLTRVGAAELTTARTAVAIATRRLVEGIDDADQETARRVLDVIHSRARTTATLGSGKPTSRD